MTAQRGGMWYNFPSIVNGQRLTPEEAQAGFERGDIKPTQGPYRTEYEAVAAARARSAAGGAFAPPPTINESGSEDLPSSYWIEQIATTKDALAKYDRKMQSYKEALRPPSRGGVYSLKKRRAAERGFLLEKNNRASLLAAVGYAERGYAQVSAREQAAARSAAERAERVERAPLLWNALYQRGGADADVTDAVNAYVGGLLTPEQAAQNALGPMKEEQRRDRFNRRVDIAQSKFLAQARERLGGKMSKLPENLSREFSAALGPWAEGGEGSTTWIDTLIGRYVPEETPEEKGAALERTQIAGENERARQVAAGTAKSETTGAKTPPQVAAESREKFHALVRQGDALGGAARGRMLAKVWEDVWPWKQNTTARKQGTEAQKLIEDAFLEIAKLPDEEQIKAVDEFIEVRKKVGATKNDDDTFTYPNKFDEEDLRAFVWERIGQDPAFMATFKAKIQDIEDRLGRRLTPAELKDLRDR